METLTNKISIMVMSCDKNQDLFLPFYHCMEKYWPDHPPIIYSTESIKNPYYSTINFDYNISHWTKRIYDTLSLISTPYVIAMVDDIFLKAPVETNKVFNILNYFDSNTAAFNLETQFDNNDIIINNEVAKRNVNGKYKTSMMCQLWAVDKLKKILNFNQDGVSPWDIERANPHYGYTFLISRNQNLFNFGKNDGASWMDWGVFRGKWTPSAIKFLRGEGLQIDTNIRGVTQLFF